MSSHKGWHPNFVAEMTVPHAFKDFKERYQTRIKPLLEKTVDDRLNRKDVINALEVPRKYFEVYERPLMDYVENGAYMLLELGNLSRILSTNSSPDQIYQAQRRFEKELDLARTSYAN